MIRDRYRHIIWDWNGTLLDDLDLCVDLVSGMLHARGRPRIDRAQYHAVFDFPVRSYYARIGFDDAEFPALSVEFIAGYDARRLEAALHPGCETLLAAIAARGVTQSILSAYRHTTLCEIVAHFGLTKHFTRLRGLDDIYAHGKIELGHASLAELGLPAREVLLIGDTLHDLEVARALGTDCVLVAHGHHPASRLRVHGVEVFANLGELAAALGIKWDPAAEAEESAGSGSPAGSASRSASR